MLVVPVELQAPGEKNICMTLKSLTRSPEGSQSSCPASTGNWSSIARLSTKATNYKVLPFCPFPSRGGEAKWQSSVGFRLLFSKPSYAKLSKSGLLLWASNGERHKTWNRCFSFFFLETLAVKEFEASKFAI